VAPHFAGCQVSIDAKSANNVFLDGLLCCHPAMAQNVRECNSVNTEEHSGRSCALIFARPEFLINRLAVQC
jgi:hypothetical protein